MKTMIWMGYEIAQEQQSAMAGIPSLHGSAGVPIKPAAQHDILAIGKSRIAIDPLP